MTKKGTEVAQAQAYTPSAHEAAYNRAIEEINEDKVREVKMIAKTILQQMQKYKEQKEDAEEAMRLLKLDLDDLREGKLEKIRERHETSKKAEMYNPISIPASWSRTGVTDDGGFVIENGNVYLSNGTAPLTNMFAQARELHNKLWNDLTSGTYTINTRNGTREFYL